MKWLALLLVICSCNTMKTSQNEPQTSIHDIYVLESVGGQRVQGKITKQSTLEINLTKMQMMGVDGCNQFGGKISFIDTKKKIIEFSDIVATEMYCDELSNKVGNSFRSVKKYKREGLELKLLSENNEVLLTYKKVD